MPFRLGPDRAKIQFTTSVQMPNLIYQACLATNVVSNTVYCQHALCEALARDLPEFSLAELVAMLPPARGPAAHLYDPSEHTMDRFSGRSLDLSRFALDQSGGRRMIGPANTVEEVR